MKKIKHILTRLKRRYSKFFGPEIDNEEFFIRMDIGQDITELTKL